MPQPDLVGEGDGVLQDDFAVYFGAGQNRRVVQPERGEPHGIAADVHFDLLRVEGDESPVSAEVDAPACIADAVVLDVVHLQLLRDVACDLVAEFVVEHDQPAAGGDPEPVRLV